MTEEERILRLENGLSTLAELAAAHQQLIAGQQRRTAGLEESFVLLTAMTHSHSESIDELRAAQAESDHKMAALAGAMIRLADSNERLTTSHERMDDSQTRLTDSQTQLAESQTQLAESLAESQKQSAESQKRLAEWQKQFAETQKQLVESQRQLAESQKQLAESQAHSDKRLDALIDIVRERRSGQS